MVTCNEVLRELSNYIDSSVSADLRERIETHLGGCSRCTVVLDTINQMIRIYSDGEVLEIPAGYNERLRAYFLERSRKEHRP